MGGRDHCQDQQQGRSDCLPACLPASLPLCLPPLSPGSSSNTVYTRSHPHVSWSAVAAPVNSASRRGSIVFGTHSSSTSIKTKDTDHLLFTCQLESLPSPIFTPDEGHGETQTPGGEAGGAELLADTRNRRSRNPTRKSSVNSLITHAQRLKQRIREGFGGSSPNSCVWGCHSVIEFVDL